MAQNPMPSSPEQALQVSRIIAIALVAGVTLFAAVTWFIQQERKPAITETSELLFYVFLGVAFASASAAMVIWRSMVAPHIEGAHRAHDTTTAMDPIARTSALQTGLIVTWAVLEGAAMLGVVAYFIDGKGLAGSLAVLLMWIGVGLTWPRREWFPATRA